jgi:hypothetical protein
VGAGTVPGSRNQVGLFWSSHDPSIEPKPLKSGEYTYVDAFGINDKGQIVGRGTVSVSRNQGLFWSSPDPSIEPKPLNSDMYRYVIAYGIN